MSYTISQSLRFICGVTPQELIFFSGAVLKLYFYKEGNNIIDHNLFSSLI